MSYNKQLHRLLAFIEKDLFSASGEPSKPVVEFPLDQPPKPQVEPQREPEPILADLVPAPEPFLGAEPITNHELDVELNDTFTTGEIEGHVLQGMAHMVKRNKRVTLAEAEELLKDNEYFWKVYNSRTWY